MTRSPNYLPRLDVYSPPFPRTSLTAHFYTASSHMQSYTTYSAVRVPEILIHCDYAVTTPFNNSPPRRRQSCHHRHYLKLRWPGWPTYLDDRRLEDFSQGYVLPVAISQDPVFRSTRFRTSKPCRDFYLFGASFPFRNSFFSSSRSMHIISVGFYGNSWTPGVVYTTGGQTLSYSLSPPSLLVQLQLTPIPTRLNRQTNQSSELFIGSPPSDQRVIWFSNRHRTQGKRLDGAGNASDGPGSASDGVGVVTISAIICVVFSVSLFTYFSLLDVMIISIISRGYPLCLAQIQTPNRILNQLRRNGRSIGNFLGGA
jgi:hypothetical protein